MNSIAPTAIIYPNVKLGTNVVIEDFVILGCPPRGAQPGEIETVIGDNATIRSSTVIYAGNQIGKNFQTGNKANIREFNTIGDDVSIGTLSVVEFRVKIGSGVRIHSQAFIPEFSTLHDHCWIGPNVVLTNARYPLSKDVRKNLVGPVIEEYAKVGANSTILPGVRIGKNSLIGAGSVVTKDVPESTVFAGNPARLLRSIQELTDYSTF